MRPRPGGRGEQHAIASLGEAELLQCGHDPEAVESYAADDAADSEPKASMRPRPGGRGEQDGRPG